MTEGPGAHRAEPSRRDRASLVRSLRLGGCVAAEEEADELARAARGGTDLDDLLERRLTGEPLAWIVGRTTFCGLDVAVERGVYVPRWQSEQLARTAARLLPAGGSAVDLGTGSGAVAMVMQAGRRDALVVGTEADPIAARCARRNGVEVVEGDLDAPLAAALHGQLDVMTGVLPYVPSEALHLLPRDVLDFEPLSALDGGSGGFELLSRAVQQGRTWLKPGGSLLLEAGSDQVRVLVSQLAVAGYVDIDVVFDDDGDARGVRGRLAG